MVLLYFQSAHLPGVIRNFGNLLDVQVKTGRGKHFGSKLQSVMREDGRGDGIGHVT